jgi:mannosyltransferase OCH1-like enzyme
MEGKEIPLNIFMTWDNKDMPINMKKSVEMVMSKNSEFNFYIYDDEDCRNFLKKYFISDIVNAFDNLIPGAFKADLWRYCVLYYYGGIYQDIKFQPVGNFNYISLLDKEYFVRDIKTSGSGIYNAFMVCKARNEILFKCIKQIIENVKNKFYGSSSLEPTGPLLMKKFFIKKEIDNLELYNKSLFISGICKDNKKILDFYKGYRIEQKKSSKPHYSYLYKIKKIYA